MQAKLKITLEAPYDLYFYTECDLELSASNAQIKFLLGTDKTSVTIGINKKKVIVMRHNPTKSSELTPQTEEFFLLSTVDNEPAKAIINFDTFDLYLLAAEYKVKFTEREVRAEMLAMVDCDIKTKEMKKIRLICEFCDK